MKREDLVVKGNAILCDLRGAANCYSDVMNYESDVAMLRSIARVISRYGVELRTVAEALEKEGAYEQV